MFVVASYVGFDQSYSIPSDWTNRGQLLRHALVGVRSSQLRISFTQSMAGADESVLAALDRPYIYDPWDVRYVRGFPHFS